MWQVQLQSHALVEHVWVTMSPGAYQKFAIFVVEMLDGTNTARYKPCAQFEVGIGRPAGSRDSPQPITGPLPRAAGEVLLQRGGGAAGPVRLHPGRQGGQVGASLLGFLNFDSDTVMRMQYSYLLLATRIFKQIEGAGQNGGS